MLNIDTKRLRRDLNFQSATGEIVAEWLVNHADHNHEVSFSRPEIAAELGMSISMIDNVLHHLKRENLAFFDRRKGTWSINLEAYVLPTDTAQNSTMDTPESQDQGITNQDWGNSSFDSVIFEGRLYLGQVKNLFTKEYLEQIERNVNCDISMRQLIFVYNPPSNCMMNKIYYYYFMLEGGKAGPAEYYQISEEDMWVPRKSILAMLENYFERHTWKELIESFQHP